MENKNRLNYFHTNVVIPNMIMSNLELFLSKIINVPENFDKFITHDTYKVAEEKLELNESEIKVNLTATNMKEYFVVFAEFPKSYVTISNANFAIAVAIRGKNIRYFTYEYGVGYLGDAKYFVGEWEFKNKEIISHLNHGQTSEYGMPKFARVIRIILEKEGN